MNFLNCVIFVICVSRKYFDALIMSMATIMQINNTGDALCILSEWLIILMDIESS